jgi:hypothetical protein
MSLFWLIRLVQHFDYELLNRPSLAINFDRMLPFNLFMKLEFLFRLTSFAQAVIRYPESIVSLA